MKRIFVITICILFSIYAFSEKEVNVKSKIKKVRVFLKGAQVYQSGYFNASSGITKLVFENISTNINLNSIQASGKGSFIILDIQHNIRYTEPAEIKKEVVSKSILKRMRILEDSLVILRFDLEDISNEMDALKREKDILLNNKIMKGQGRSDTMPVLKDALQYFRQRINDINTRSLKLKRQQYYKTNTLSKHTANLNELKAYKQRIEQGSKGVSKAVQQVVVTISSKASVSGNMTINYLVNNAGWSPSYDLRAKNAQSPVRLTYKANVYQHTGTDWSNVKLSLSTLSPNRSNTKPALPVWYLNYYVANRTTTRSGGVLKDVSLAKKSLVAESDEKFDDDLVALTPVDYTTMVENLTNIEFDISLAYNIPSDGKNHLVLIQDNEIKSKYNHYLVPKIDNDAFLVASLTGWEKYKLMAGTANIYFGGTYIGQTTINPSIQEDTLRIGLGREKAIVVKRKRLKEKEKTKTSGSNITKTIVYEIQLRNTKSVSTSIIIEDQIPVSLNPEIKVDLEHMTDGKYIEKEGRMVWNIKLKPYENRKITFTYTVKHDKNRNVSVY